MMTWTARFPYSNPAVRLRAAGAPPLLAIWRQPKIRLLHLAVLALLVTVVHRPHVRLRAASAPPLLLPLIRQPKARRLAVAVLAP